MSLPSDQDSDYYEWTEMSLRSRGQGRGRGRGGIDCGRGRGGYDPSLARGRGRGRGGYRGFDADYGGGRGGRGGTWHARPEAAVDGDDSFDTSETGYRGRSRGGGRAYRGGGTYRSNNSLPGPSTDWDESNSRFDDEDDRSASSHTLSFRSRGRGRGTYSRFADDDDRSDNFAPRGRGRGRGTFFSHSLNEHYEQRGRGRGGSVAYRGFVSARGDAGSRYDYGRDSSSSNNSSQNQKNVGQAHSTSIFNMARMRTDGKHYDVVFVVPKPSSTNQVASDGFVLPFTSSGCQDAFLSDELELEPGKVAIKAHKLILAHASSYFNGMFYGGIQTEGRVVDGMTVVNINDVESDVLNYMLDVIYDVPIPDSTVILASKFEKVLFVATRFDIHDLRKPCVKYLMENLSPEHAVARLPIAEKYHLSQYKTAILKLILEDMNTALRPECFSQISAATWRIILSCERTQKLNLNNGNKLYNILTEWAANQVQSSGMPFTTRTVESVMAHFANIFPRHIVDAESYAIFWS